MLDLLADLPRRQKVVLVMDLVESVRLMEADETQVIQQWRRFLHDVTLQVLPPLGGRLVKSLGDGVMLEFDRAPQAIEAALALHRLLAPFNAGRPPAQQMLLRGGANATQVFVDDIDIYGSGVNLAARMATLAGPGETVVTSSVRDGLTDGLDADIEDVGECYLKHIEKPVRAYRVREPGPRPRLRADPVLVGLLHPILAVIPLTSRSHDADHYAVGELVADGLMAQLSRARDLKVISRLSCTALRGRATSPAQVESLLGATHVLSGSYVTVGQRLLLTLELSETSSAHICWTERILTSIEDLLQVESDTCHTLASAVHRAILNSEIERVQVQPLPTLKSYALLLGGVHLMHRVQRADFQRAHDIFSYLGERLPKHPTPRALLAQWHVMEIHQGWSTDHARSAERALAHSSRALELDPEAPLALAMDGWVRADSHGDFDGALDRCNRAIAIDPNEPLSWLFKGLLDGFRGNTHNGVAEVSRARALSPLDPAKYFFDSLAAAAHLSAGQYQSAITLASASRRANRYHLSTHRTLAIALTLDGQAERAHDVVRELLTLDPSFTVSTFTSRRPASRFCQGSLFASALREAGVPA